MILIVYERIFEVEVNLFSSQRDGKSFAFQQNKPLSYHHLLFFDAFGLL